MRSIRPRPSARTLLVAGLVAVAAVAVLLVTGRDDGARIPDGVRVAGVDVGGLEEDVARGALVRHARAAIARGVTVRAEGAPAASVTLGREALRPAPRIEEALAEARDAPGPVGRFLGAVGIPRTRDIPLRYRFPPGRLEAAVARAQARVGRRPRPATVRLRGDRLEVVAGTPGVGIGAAELAARLETLPAEITVARVPVPPPVTTDAARAARARGEALAASPPTVVSGSTRARLQPQTILRALRFTPDDGALLVSLDPEVIGDEVRSVFGDRERGARDARFAVTGTRVRVVPDRPGTRIDTAALAAALARAPGAEVTLPVRRLPARRTAGALRRLRVDAVVADYATEYPCCEPRVTNIRRAAEILDGVVIPAGGRFSLNEAMGERTLARGFVPAPVIADGRFEEGVGGGVSQMATTLFNAAFFAGLELVAHTPHEVYISRYPMGREATVSWGGPDLVFRNDWDAAVVLDVSAGDTSVRVRMLSRALGRRVETETSDPTDYREPEVIRTVDPTLAPGVEEVDQALGGAGFTVRYTRRVYRGSALVRDETRSWTYRPVDARVRVGPGEPDTGTTTGTPTDTGPAAPGTTTAPPG